MAAEPDSVLFVRMDETLHTRIKMRAEDVGVPVAEWVRRVLMQALDKPIREYKVDAVRRV